MNVHLLYTLAELTNIYRSKALLPITLKETAMANLKAQTHIQRCWDEEQRDMLIGRTFFNHSDYDDEHIPGKIDTPTIPADTFPTSKIPDKRCNYPRIS